MPSAPPDTTGTPRQARCVADRTRHLDAVDRCGPRADHGDRGRRARSAASAPSPTDPEACRRTRASPIASSSWSSAGGPFGVAGDEEADAAPLGLVELPLGVDLGQPLREHAPRSRPRLAGAARAPARRRARADERRGRAVAGLDGAAQGHPRQPLCLGNRTHHEFLAALSGAAPAGGETRGAHDAATRPHGRAASGRRRRSGAAGRSRLLGSPAARPPRSRRRSRRGVGPGSARGG